MTTALALRDLNVTIADGRRTAHILRGVDLDLPAGVATGLVGESGSGKTTTMLAVTGLLPQAARIVRGSISFEGRELTGLRERDWRHVRGAWIASMFQNARGALHPMRSIGDQLVRVYRAHVRAREVEARKEALRLLEAVGLPDPREIAHRYPHQLSGGQCQRAMIALALIARPRLILADEPTSGLDVTVQEQVLAVLAERVREAGVTLLLISHDLHVIERSCSRFAVMYAGEIVEEGAREQVLSAPAHPYTRGLLQSLELSDGRFGFIPGAVPDLHRPIEGCPFAPRCAHASELCWRGRPALRLAASGQSVRCVLHDADPARRAAVAEEARC